MARDEEVAALSAIADAYERWAATRRRGVPLQARQRHR